MKKAAFRAEVLDGHKGPAVLVPFDPEELWEIAPTPIVSATYGERPGHWIAGTFNGHPFEGWIGNRWGRFFILVDAALQRAARVSVGDVVDIVIAPRLAPKARASAAKRKPVGQRKTRRRSTS